MGADTRTGTASAAATTPASGRKRKHTDCAAHSVVSSSPTITISDDTQQSTPSKKQRSAKPAPTSAEKRLRRFRPHPPQAFHDLYTRATTQRFYVLSRTRHAAAASPFGTVEEAEAEAEQEETVVLTGSTGNIYTTTIARQSRCDCPHARAGHTQCKHIVYVLARVLRARYDLVYQLALLAGEVREVLAGAPLPPATGGDGGDAKGKRKAVEGDCPICFCEMDDKGAGGEAVVWCRAACGQNVHRGCFETWAATKRRQAGGGGEVTCPYCRSVWEGDEDMVARLQTGGERNAEGYVNVAGQLGISGRRDYSTYSKWWSGHPSGYRRRYY